jgi:hypothetical protein
MPLLLQGRLRAENRPITPQAIRALLNIAVDQSGLTDAVGQPLRFAPHGLRRMLRSLPVARLLQGLVGRDGREFEAYLRRTNAVEVPDEDVA